MGTFSPSPFYTEEVDEFCKKYVYQPTVDAMAAEGRPFKGIIFFGLMLTQDGPKVLEYNARFGDPEADIAPVIAFLAGPDSCYFSGQSVIVDGANSIMP